jgi:signal transduction histidine kinase
VAEFGTAIYKSGQRLYRLIQNYLIYAQLELKNIDASEGEELKDAGLICRKKAEEIANRYGRTDDLLVYAGVTRVFAKKDNLEKIVEELVDNAFKFSERGSRVVVTCQMAENTFKLSVVDHGRGIAQDDVRRIGAYMQFDRMLHAQQGSGLGLIIARRIAELMKGGFELDSKLGEGTTIQVSLPGDALSLE